MSAFDLYADLQYKKRLGKLSDEEAFFVSFITTFFGLCIFFFYSILVGDFTTKDITRFSKEMKIFIGLLPIIVGLIGIFLNRLQKNLVKSQMKNYKQQGFSEKESLEQVLADKRVK